VENCFLNLVEKGRRKKSSAVLGKKPSGQPEKKNRRDAYGKGENAYRISPDHFFVNASQGGKSQISPSRGRERLFGVK